MQEIGSQLILSRLELFLRAALLVENGDVKAELLALEQVSVEEVNDL